LGQLTCAVGNCHQGDTALFRVAGLGITYNVKEFQGFVETVHSVVIRIKGGALRCRIASGAIESSRDFVVNVHSMCIRGSVQGARHPFIIDTECVVQDLYQVRIVCVGESVSGGRLVLFADNNKQHTHTNT